MSEQPPTRRSHFEATRSPHRAPQDIPEGSAVGASSQASVSANRIGPPGIPRAPRGRVRETPVGPPPSGHVYLPDRPPDEESS